MKTHIISWQQTQPWPWTQDSPTPCRAISCRLIKGSNVIILHSNFCHRDKLRKPGRGITKEAEANQGKPSETYTWQARRQAVLPPVTPDKLNFPLIFIVWNLIWPLPRQRGARSRGRGGLQPLCPPSAGWAPSAKEPHGERPRGLPWKFIAITRLKAQTDAFDKPEISKWGRWGEKSVKRWLILKAGSLLFSVPTCFFFI